MHSSSTPVGPVEIYGESKVHGEELLQAFHVETGVSSTALRLFNAVGRRETNPHVIPHIFESLKTSDVVPLGNTDARRDYVDSRDVATAVLSVLHAGRGHSVMNVGTGVAWSVNDLYRGPAVDPRPRHPGPPGCGPHAALGADAAGRYGAAAHGDRGGRPGSRYPPCWLISASRAVLRALAADSGVSRHLDPCPGDESGKPLRHHADAPEHDGDDQATVTSNASAPPTTATTHSLTPTLPGVMFTILTGLVSA